MNSSYISLRKIRSRIGLIQPTAVQLLIDAALRYIVCVPDTDKHHNGTTANRSNKAQTD